MFDRSAKNKDKAAFIYGAGGHGRVVLDVLRSQGGWRSIEFVDMNRELAGREINGAKVVGDLDAIDRKDTPSCGIVVAIGHPSVRAKLANDVASAGISFINAIHSSAFIAESAEIGDGNMICPMSVINSNAKLGNHIIINTAVVVEHDNVIDDFVSLSPGCVIGGRVEIGKAAFIGMKSVILPRLKIGANSIIGAGSVVTKDVPPNVLVLGSPARVIEKVGPDFDFSRLF